MCQHFRQRPHDRSGRVNYLGELGRVGALLSQCMELGVSLLCLKMFVWVLIIAGALPLRLKKD